MTDIPPRNEHFLKLQELNVAKVKDGKWVFSEGFVESVHEMNSKRHSRLTHTRLAYGFTSKMASTIVAYPSFRNKENLNALCGSYIFLTNYLKKNKVKTPKKLDDLVYTVWYIDEHEPEVEE